VLDENGKFIDVNKGALKMYGYSLDELVGKDPSFVSADGKNDLDKVARMVQLAFEGTPQQFEFWGKRANGEPFLKDVRLHSGFYYGKKVVVATAQDITRRKLDELELKQKIDELEDVNKIRLYNEQRVDNLKREVNELLVQMGLPEKYRLL
jgi:PAS domain S-box-containing protein